MAAEVGTALAPGAVVAATGAAVVSEEIWAALLRDEDGVCQREARRRDRAGVAT